MDIGHASRRISTSLHRELRAGRLARIDIDSVRCAVAGYFLGADHLPTVHQVEDLENLTLRKIVEAA